MNNALWCLLLLLTRFIVSINELIIMIRPPYKPTEHLVFLGDSLILNPGDPTTIGWTGRLNISAYKQSPTIQYHNLGILNETSKQLFERLEMEWTLRFQIRDHCFVILHSGMYDTYARAGKVAVPLNQTIENLSSVFEFLKPKAKSILLGPTPIFDPEGNQRIRRLNMSLQEFCHKKHIPYINLYSLLQNDVEFKRKMAQNPKEVDFAPFYEKIADHISDDQSWWF